MRRITTAAAALLVGAGLAQAAALEEANNGLFRKTYADFGEWRVWRYYGDKAGQNFSHCMAMVGFDGDQLIEVRADGKAVTFGFLGGYGFATVEKETKVSMTVQGKRAMVAEITLKPQLTDYGVTLNQIMPGTADLTDIFMNSDGVEFAAPGGSEVSFDLKGSHKAIAALIECAGAN